MKKLLFITYYWPPSGGAGVQRSLKFVKYLPELGIEPIVLTVDERFASYPIIDDSLLKEVPENIKVYRTKSLEALKVLSLFTNKKNIPHGGFANSNKESIFQKLLRYIRGNLFIPDARLGWISFAEKTASEIIEREKLDTVFITSPPHSSQLIGLRLKSKFKIRLIVDLRDPWTDIFYYKDLMHTKNSAIKDSAFERQVLINADELITVSSPLTKLFLSKSSELNQDKFHVIPNGFDEEDFLGEVKTPEDIFQITYVGSIADTYRPELFFEVMKKLINQFQSVKFKIRFVGSLPQLIRNLIYSNGLESITEFISNVSHSSAVQYMRQTTILLLLIPEVPNNDGILTGKLFEYLGARRPIIGLGPRKGQASMIISECESGKMFERNEEKELYSYLNALILRWQDKKAILNENNSYKSYSRRELAKDLASIVLKKQ